MARPSLADIRQVHWAIVAAILVAQAVALWSAGRNPICTRGHVRMWHGALDAGNGRHIADCYTLSHIIHGLLFYAIGWLPLPPSAGERPILTVVLEAASEC